MVNIRCYKCDAKSSGDTINEARSIMNHAVGISRGIKCGDNYNCIEEIVDKIKDTVTNDTVTKESTTQEETAPVPQTPKEHDQNNSPNDTDEAKHSKNKSKKKFY